MYMQDSVGEALGSGIPLVLIPYLSPLISHFPDHLPVAPSGGGILCGYFLLPFPES